jgi:tetratricopeptide (TPR) repeat protein
MELSATEYDGEESTFPGTVSGNFSASNYSEGDFDDDESETYYSEGLGRRGGSLQESYRSSDDSQSSGSLEGDSLRSHDDQQKQQQHHSASQSRQSGMDRISIAKNYRQEFEDLIQLAENGRELTTEEEDRLYFLELYARRRVGEELVTEELLDLEDWMREEEEKVAGGSDSHLDTIDENPAPSIDGSNSLSRTVEPNTPSERNRGARQVSDHENEENSEESSKGPRSTSTRIRQSELSPYSAEESKVDTGERVNVEDTKNTTSRLPKSESEGFGGDALGNSVGFQNELVDNDDKESQEAIFAETGDNAKKAQPTFETSGSNDSFGQLEANPSDWGDSDEVEGEETRTPQAPEPEHDIDDENDTEESDQSRSQQSTSERREKSETSHHSTEELGASFEQLPSAFENEGFEDNEFGEFGSFPSDLGGKNTVDGEEKLISKSPGLGHASDDENNADQAERKVPTAERIAESNNSHHSTEEFGANFEQPPTAFENDGFTDVGFGQFESFSSDWGENNQVKGDEESKSQIHTPSNSMGDENGFDESEASNSQSSTSERIAESNNSHHSAEEFGADFEQSPTAFENDGFRDVGFGQSGSVSNNWGENNQVRGDEESKSQTHTPSNSVGDENDFDESEASNSQSSASERKKRAETLEFSAEGLGTDFEQPTDSFYNDVFKDDGFGQFETYPSDWGDNDKAAGNNESKPKPSVQVMDDKNDFNESDASRSQLEDSRRSEMGIDGHFAHPSDARFENNDFGQIGSFPSDDSGGNDMVQQQIESEPKPAAQVIDDLKDVHDSDGSSSNLEHSHRPEEEFGNDFAQPSADDFGQNGFGQFASFPSNLGENDKVERDDDKRIRATPLLTRGMDAENDFDEFAPSESQLGHSNRSEAESSDVLAQPTTSFENEDSPDDVFGHFGSFPRDWGENDNMESNIQRKPQTPTLEHDGDDGDSVDESDASRSRLSEEELGTDFEQTTAAFDTDGFVGDPFGQFGSFPGDWSENESARDPTSQPPFPALASELGGEDSLDESDGSRSQLEGMGNLEQLDDFAKESEDGSAKRSNAFSHGSFEDNGLVQGDESKLNGGFKNKAHENEHSADESRSSASRDSIVESSTPSLHSGRPQKESHHSDGFNPSEQQGGKDKIAEAKEVYDVEEGDHQSRASRSQGSTSEASEESKYSQFSDEQSNIDHVRPPDDANPSRSHRSVTSRSAISKTEYSHYSQEESSNFEAQSPSFTEESFFSSGPTKQAGEVVAGCDQAPGVFQNDSFGQFDGFQTKLDGDENDDTSREESEPQTPSNQFSASAASEGSISHHSTEISNIASETISFAEGSEFSPFPKNLKAQAEAGLKQQPVASETEGFSNDGFGPFPNSQDLNPPDAFIGTLPAFETNNGENPVPQEGERNGRKREESPRSHSFEGDAFGADGGFGASRKDNEGGASFGDSDFPNEAFGAGFDAPGDEDLISDFGAHSVPSKPTSLQGGALDQSRDQSRRSRASNRSRSGSHRPDLTSAAKDDSLRSEAKSLCSTGEPSKALPSKSQNESLAPSFSGLGEDSWSQLDQPESPSIAHSMQSLSQRLSSRHTSSVLSPAGSTNPSAISTSTSIRSSVGAHSVSTRNSVPSKQDDGQSQSPSDLVDSQAESVGPETSVHSGSRSFHSSESQSRSQQDSVHSHSVSSHYELGSPSQTERGSKHSESRSAHSVQDEGARSANSLENEDDGDGSVSDRDHHEDDSLSSKHSESMLSGSLVSNGPPQFTALAEKLSHEAQEDKSIGTPSEKSVRFNMSPKPSSESDPSLHLGEVFGKPDNYFDDVSQAAKSVESQSESQSDKSTDKASSSSKSNRIKDHSTQNEAKTIRSGKEIEERRKKRKKRRRLRKEAKSLALLDLVANVNDAMLALESHEDETKETNMETSAHRLLHGFDALVGIYLQLSDEIELISTVAGLKKKDEDSFVSHQSLKEVLSFAESLDQLFADLQPIILDCFEEEPDEEMDDMLFRLNSLVDLLCETSHRVGEKQEWNDRVETTYVTILELMELETLELQCYFEDVDVPEQGISANIHEAWSATGHIEELEALQFATNDPLIFRQICYEVMVSTDQWCPDVTMLMEICGIDGAMLEEEPDPEYLEEEDLAPIPQAAEHVLDKINGDPLPRSATLASILRRILPPRAMTDLTLLDNFTSIRNTLNNPLGLSATNIVAISSAPEVLNSPDALGVSGSGKTTLAAMVAEHPDVRRYFIDGVVWIHVGDKELTYSRYTQCLRELVAQLDFYEGVPLFAELIHTPGECLTKRRRREEGFMIYARDTIVELLEDRSVLIILDDVCFEPDLDWFDFAPMPEGSQDDSGSDVALLVTTRIRDLLPAADTVEVDMLDEADAISLLIQESGQLSHTLMAESREARSVVRECANHPLAVKSVGRWLNLKHATAGVVSSVEEIHSEVVKSMDKILKGGDHSGTDMMYEILSLSLSPAINGEPTNIIKFCLAAFVVVFCNKEYISEFALTEPNPIIPMDMAELLFETLLEINESSLLQEGSLFYAQKKEAAVLIPEALSALGVLKVITYSDAEDGEEEPEDEQKFLQVMHSIHHEYGEYLCYEEPALKELTKDAEQEWNRSLVEASLKEVEEWDIDLEDAGHSYALEMIIAHMLRGGMYSEAADLLANKSFVRGRLLSLGRENATRRHIKDCVMLSTKLNEGRSKISQLEPRSVMKHAYQALGSQLTMEYDDEIIEDPRIKDIEIARAHHEIGFSLAENRCWDAAIAHWETSQELLEKALGTVEVVAGIMHNIGVVYSQMNEYEKALDSIKQCLRIRGTIHGEQHILYAQTIQRIGDIFLGMSDYHEAVESYNWALDVMYKEPALHRVEIGEILDNKGTIHYSKGEIEEALQCHQEALRSKQVDLGEDHPELVVTYHHIGNCLSDQGNVDDAIIHFEEAIRLKELDLDGGPERDSDILTIEGILHNLEGNQEQGLECYEKSLQILVTKVSHRKEKVASLLHLIGCVYLMSGEQKKAMKLFEESLQARRKVLGFVHLDVASTLFNMAFLHQTRNRLDKALKCLEEALKIRQLRLPDSEKVAVTHEKIGSLARAIGKTKKAQIAFEAALKIRKLIHGEQHEAVATVLQELGDLMDDIGEYDTAMSHYIDALDIRRNRLGLDDIAVAETLYSMGYTLHNNDEPDRALVCFEESLSIRRYQLGEDSKEVGDTLNMMGFLKAKRGELDDALTILWDALRIRKLQEDNVKVSETLKNIGNVHREKQEQVLAVKCYEECLRIRRTELGEDHEKVADALIAMGNVYGDIKKNDEAMRSYQEALRIRTMVFGEQDESVAAVLQYMGTMEFRAGNHERARDLLTEFIRIRRDNSTKNDGDYVNVLFMIGNIHKMQGNEEDARLCWTEAYQVFQELGLEQTNPQIASMMNELLKLELKEDDETDQKKNAALTFFGKMAGKSKEPAKEVKPLGRKTRRSGKGIQL